MSEGNGHSNGDGVHDQRDNNGKLVGGITGKGFMPGQSGNPGGRPKGRTVLSEILSILEDDEERRKLALACIEKANEGSFQHLQEIIQRQDGKVPDKVDLQANLNHEGDPLRGTELIHALIAQSVQQRSGSNGHAAPIPAGDSRLAGE